jgi:maltose O-acetyltransferase
MEIRMTPNNIVVPRVRILAQWCRAEIDLATIGLANGIINLLPDTWLVSLFLRPLVARGFGLRCGRGTSLRKGIYYGNPKNISFGCKVGVNREVFFDGYDRICIGSNVAIGFRAVFITGSHDIGPVERRCGELIGKPINVEDGAWIGANATIGPGVTIGAGSVVSAGAVVLRSVPPDVFVAGSPARIVQHLDRSTNREEVEPEERDGVAAVGRWAVEAPR